MNRIGALHFFSWSPVTSRFLMPRPAAANAFTSLSPYRNLANAFACSSVSFGLSAGITSRRYDPRPLPSSTAFANTSISRASALTLLREDGGLPAVDDAQHAVGVRRRHLAGDDRAHRVADQVGLRQFEVIEQPDHVLGHLGAVLFRLVRLVALPVPAQIHRDQLVLFGRGVGVEPPPHAGITHPAVEEDDGFALPCRDVPNLDAVRVEHVVGCHGGLGREQNAMNAASRDRYLMTGCSR